MEIRNETLGENILSTQQKGTITISDEVFSYLSFALKMVLNPALGAVGICTNIINTIVFFRMGLSDGVSQNFFILSICDGLYAIVALMNSMMYILWWVITAYLRVVTLKINVHVIYQASFFPAPFIRNISIVVTVVIVVVRCCSVAMPLKVKYILTARRQLTVILLFSGIAVSISVYCVSPVRLFHVENPVTNISMSYFGGAHWSTYTIFNNISTFGGFIICIVCVFILSSSLRKASKFRESSTSATSTSANHGNDSASASVKKSKERQRNSRVVRTVLFVSLVFIVCNISPISHYILVAFFGHLKYADALSLMLTEMSALVSVVVNIFIYVSNNSRYRHIFLIMIGQNLNTDKEFSLGKK